MRLAETVEEAVCQSQLTGDDTGMNTQILTGVLLPFFGTSFGAAMVFFLKDSISNMLQRILTGFAAGVMVAASFWSLLQPALEESAHMRHLSFCMRISG